MQRRPIGLALYVVVLTVPSVFGQDAADPFQAAPQVEITVKTETATPTGGTVDATGVPAVPVNANAILPWDPSLPLPEMLVPSNRYGCLDLVTLDATGKEVGLPPGDAQGMIEPAWSPDGQRVAFVSHRTGVSQIYVMNADGSNVVNVTRSGSTERNPTWSPDGGKLAFTSDRTGNWEIFSMQADGTAVTNLTNSPNSYDADPAWSPDGTQIAFASNRVGAFRLFLMNADGSNARDLLNVDQGGALYPAWSPDGKQILYGGRTETGMVQLFVVGTNGQGPIQISDGVGFKSFPAWSPDGRFIAYVHFDGFPASNSPGTLIDVNAPGGNLVIYDAVEDTHVVVSTGDLPPWGPRPTWKPALKPVQ